MKLRLNPAIAAVAIAAACVAFVRPVAAAHPLQPTVEHNRRPLVQNVMFGADKVGANDPIAKYVVGLRLHKDNGNWLTCTGFMIAPRLVMTSAHCVDKIRVKRIQVHFSRGLMNTKSSRIYGVSRVVIHEQFVRDTTSTRDPYDVAILKIDHDMPKSYEVPQVASLDFDYSAVREVRAAGFGVPSMTEAQRIPKWNKILLGANIPVARAYIPVGDGWFFDKMLALDQTGGSGMCEGDSGAPVFYEHSGELTVIGLHEGGVQDGSGPNVCAGHGVAIRLSAIGEWMKKTADEMSR